MTTEDPYSSPLHYNLEYQDQTADIDWYVALCRRVKGPVLELGCGNGRITLHLARAGVRVHGIDRSRPMLASLEAQLQRQSEVLRAQVTYERGDFLALEKQPKHPLVILPFNTLHHCLGHADVLTLFDGVRGSLAPDGQFALDCYLPAPELYGRDPNDRYGERIFDHPLTGEIIESWEQSWYDPLLQLHHVTYVYRHGSGHVEEVNLHLRVFYPQELRALIDWAGFTIVEEYANFQRAPLANDATKWVMVLAPK